MDFIDEIRTRSGRFAARAEHFKDSLEITEEATKTSFVLPFIQMLGYDIFNPAEVKPEFTADIGTKRGEKVDFALFVDGAPMILIECKKYQSPLEDAAISQLLRYFGVTDVKVGILTDGICYRFFSDLDQSNVMDPRPFFEFNMLDFTEHQVKELKRFSKEDFDKSHIMEVARELRYAAEIKSLFADELSEPSDDLVRFVIKKVYKGRLSSTSRKMFKDLTYLAFNQFINEKIQDRLAKALKQDEDQGNDRAGEEKNETKPEFVESELAGLNTLKAILGGMIDPECIGMRSNQRNASIVLHSSPKKDDFGKVLCRLWARRRENMRLDLPDREPIDLEGIEDLFEHTDVIRQALQESLPTSQTETENAEGQGEDEKVVDIRRAME